MRKILIVDDEIIVRKWLKLTFSEYTEEFEIVYSASNGIQALEFCSSNKVDIIITDIIMPDMDGIEFIQKLRETNDVVQIIILSNHENFDFARKCMVLGASEYLLKGEVTEAEIIDSCRKIANKIQQAERNIEELICLLGVPVQDIHNMISGISDYDPSNSSAALSKCFDKLRLYIIVFAVDGYKRMSAIRSSPGILSIDEIVLDSIKQSYFPAAYENYSYKFTDNLYLTLVAMDLNERGSAEIIKKFCYDVNDNVKISGLTVSAGISGAISGYDQLQMHFSNACRALRYRFYANASSVQLYTELSQSVPGNENIFPAVVMKCQEILKTGDFISARDYIRQFLSDRKSIVKFDIDRVKRLINQVSEIFLVSTYTSGRTDEACLNSINPHLEIASMDFLDEMIKWLNEVIDRCVLINTRAVDDKNIKKATRYIDSHYMENITLTKISEIVGYSPHYFCLLFKEKTNKSFNTYLTEVRINNAKNLLLSGNMSISLIAEQTGYEATSYFIKVFKDYVGCTPNKFRKNKGIIT